MCKSCHSHIGRDFTPKPTVFIPANKILGRYDEIENREAEELKQEPSDELVAACLVVVEARLVLKESERIALSRKGPRMKALAAALEKYDAAT